MKKIKFFFLLLTLTFLLPLKIFGADGVPIEVSNFTSETLSLVTLLTTATAVFFLIKSGYLYMVSAGNPELIAEAKKTIKNSLIGLVIVLSASLLVSLMKEALIGGQVTSTSSSMALVEVESIEVDNALSQVLMDSISGLIQNMVSSATKPIVEGVMTFLNSTPTVLGNEVILKFWLIILGITNSLMVLVIALLGLELMSGSSFGFEELDLRELLPKIGITFLGANVSLFLVDLAIRANNALVAGVLNSTGGLSQAWLSNVFKLSGVGQVGTPLIVLLFLLLFLLLSSVLLFFYISRLISIILGAVLSPLVFLLWLIPKTQPIAEMAIKGYLATIFSVFIHVVTIQLASAFLTVPQSDNSLISIAIAIGMLSILIKIPKGMLSLVMSAGKGLRVKQVSGVFNNFSNFSHIDELIKESRLQKEEQ